MKHVEIELKADAKPYASRFYNVPKAYKKIAKTEIHHVCTIIVVEKLSHTKDSPWDTPSFCQILKTGVPCFLTDFREVNKCIQRKPFSLPRINKSLQKVDKFRSATAIDLCQGYYSILLSKKKSENMYNNITLGKVRLYASSNGHSLRSRHFPIHNDKFTGQL